MRILALDTTTPAGSVALVEDARVVREHEGDATRPHAERLPRDILDLLAAVGRSPADVDLFAVASGPGSFTGLRIGIATIQGLAFVQRRQIATISALEALAHAGSTEAPPGTLVGVWMDARRRDVFSALYCVQPFALFDSRRLREIEPPQVEAPANVLARWHATSGRATIAYVGDGAVLFADLIRAGDPAAPIAGHPALAGTIGRLALGHAAEGRTLDPGAVRALYVRRPDAEVERDRRLDRLASPAR